MYSSMLSAVVQGLEVTIIRVEMDVSNGLPSFQIVGSASMEVKEAGERVRTAIKNLGYQLPVKKVVGNLTPAHVRKEGVNFDIPIAIAMLGAYGILSSDKIENVLAVGEVGLDGNIRSTKGVLPIVSHGKRNGITKFIVPKGNAKEAAMIEEVDIFGADNLEQVIQHFLATPLEKEKNHLFQKENSIQNQLLDYNEIHGQEHVKRAVEIAVAGKHNMLMIGPPGSGKSMIAKRIPTILPELSMEDSMEISRVYSIVGLLNNEEPYMSQRPFRNVHHTITKTALVGGGNLAKPGELSLAHGGVLFLDELPEFNKSVLEVLRQPLEDKKIRIVRNKGSYVFPANVMLVAAMNPCPCGNYPDLNRCSCTEYDINRYLSKISQPLLDRIDICVEVPRVKYDVLVGKKEKKELGTKEMKERILKAMELQKIRFSNTSIISNEEIPTHLIEKYCTLDTNCKQLMELAYEKLNLTARTYYKILKVARTIADLEGEDSIQEMHIKEAIGYRMIDKKYWGR